MESQPASQDHSVSFEPHGAQAGVQDVQDQLRHRFEFENLITSLSTDFINLPTSECDQGIIRALEALGTFSAVDRSYIFLLSEDSQRMSNTHEWCSPGTQPFKDQLQDISPDDFPWFMNAMRRHETLYIPSVEALPPEACNEKKTFIEQSVKSMLCVPMVYRGRLMGFLGFDSVVAYKEWSDEASSLLEIAGEMFVNVIQRMKIENALKARDLFMEDVFSSIQDGVCVLDCDLTIMRANPVLENWHPYAKPIVGKKCYAVYHNRTTPCEICPSLRTLQTGKAQYDVIPRHGEHNEITGWLDLFTFPLVDAQTGTMKGVIEFVRDITQRKRAEEEKEKLTLELMRSNKRLKRLALRDSLTGLFNHRFLQEALESEFYRCRRYGQPLSLMMCDIDYFKSVNDVYGHRFGDAVLKQASRCLRGMVRRYDAVIRYSGGGFVVLCPGIDRVSAFSLAQRILDAINLMNFGDKKHTVKLKLSMAVASYPEDRVVKAIELIELADEIIAKAKEAGGNRVLSLPEIRNGASNGKAATKLDSVRTLKGKLERLSRKANQGIIEAIFAFAKTIEVKDHYTGEHVEKTVQYAVEIARGLSMGEQEVELIRQAAMLHDLGKVGIAEHILLKKGTLTRKEFEEIKKHPQIGVDIIRPVQSLHPIIPYLLYHHERWDGKGYPAGLRGEDIPLGARIVALADVYQALISDRPYRKAYTAGKAKDIIRSGSGSYFDPLIVTTFLRVLS